MKEPYKVCGKDESPKLKESDIHVLTQKALESPRLRYAEILHNAGDKFNRVINCISRNSYMRPHLHPAPEKIEQITVLHGSLCLFFFGDQGQIVKSKILSENGEHFISVPAFSWHTYVILTDYAVTYETMMGAYDPKTWKTMAKWAPDETSVERFLFLKNLQNISK